MSSCPLCQHQVEISDRHFGALYTCPSCAGIFFVSWDGTPEIASHESENLFENVPNEEAPLTNDFMSQSFESSQPLDDAPIDNAFASIEEPNESAPVENYDFNSPVGAVTFESSVNDSSDLSDIADFGNSPQVGGGISYTLTISAIDSAKVYSLVEEAVTDTRFGWEAKELMAKINGGVLEISNLPLVKAYVLIDRLQSLPVKFSWRQDVL